MTPPANPGKITWYNGQTIDTTVLATTSQVIAFKDVAGNQFEGDAAVQLSSPSGIFLDAAGYLYVADAENNRIQKFPPGSFYTTPGVTVAGGNGAGAAANQLSGPSAVFVDAAGNLYVADTYNSRIQEFPSGSSSATNGVTVAGGNGPGSAANQFEPTGVWLDAAGRLYVTDYANGRVLEFPPGSTPTTNGVTIAGGNGQGSAANQLAGPYCGILDRNGNLYVADQANQRVQEFPAGSTGATNGVTVAGGNGLGSGPNQLGDPGAIFLDRWGNLYVDDMENNRIQVFPPGSTSATNGVTSLKGSEDALNQFTNSYGIFVDSIGNVYFSNVVFNYVAEAIFTRSIDTIYTPSAPGTYTAVVTDLSGCSDTTNAIVIRASPLPSLTIAANATAACAGDTIMFIASPVDAGPAASFQWQVNGINTGSDDDTLVLSTLLNNDAVRCILTSHKPCQASVSSGNEISVDIYPLPVVTFNPDTLVINGGARILLNPTISGTIASVLWSPSTGLNNPDLAAPLASPVSSTTYQLSVTDDKGCRTSGKETVLVSYPLAVPNAFTPNGDGKNDVFRIPPSTSREIRSLAVYNRWGTRVFATADASIGWDGTFEGQPQPTGTYVWQVRYQDALSKKMLFASGTVLLVR